MAFDDSSKIRSPDDPLLEKLCESLRAASSRLEDDDGWPQEQLRDCGQQGVYEWFLEEPSGGQAWSSPDLCRGYLALSAACLTTTFVITQYMGACQRIAASGNRSAQQRWLPSLIRGDEFGTVGISHLTTSRRHLRQPVLRAEARGQTLRLTGYSPWVTGADRADVVVVGATLDDGRQLLAAVPATTPGLHVPPPLRLLALSASRTGPVQLENVEVPEQWLLAGPAPEIMQSGRGANTGGVQTSTLALGLSGAAIDFLEQESQRRADLQDAGQALRTEYEQLVNLLLQVALGQPPCSTELLRSRANSLVLRATQAALVAAKGAGYVAGHVVGRWCREAMFFLVWSCPQNVLAAHLCELAGVTDD
jgi:alkylation response protein AidB-like acyl-CoA dehydrogenase